MEISLSEAPEHFAPAWLRRANSNVQSAPAKTEKYLELAKSNPAMAISEFTQDCVRAIAEHSNPVLERRKWLARGIISGKFVAHGFRADTGSSKEMETIPAQFFEKTDKIDWHNSVVAVAGRKYEFVRVAKRAAATSGRNDPTGDAKLPVEGPVQNEETPKRTRPGPKSSFDAFKRVYEDLSASGQFSDCRTVKEQLRKIHRQLPVVLSEYGLEKMPNEKTLYHHMRRIKNQ